MTSFYLVELTKYYGEKVLKISVFGSERKVQGPNDLFISTGQMRDICLKFRQYQESPQRKILVIDIIGQKSLKFYIQRVLGLHELYPTTPKYLKIDF